MSAVTFYSIKNQVEDLVNDFLDGRNLQAELSNEIFKIFNTDNKLSYLNNINSINRLFNNSVIFNSTFNVNDNLNYLDAIDDIKKLLSNSVISNITKYNNFFILDIKKKLSNSEIAAIVRFINICHNNDDNVIIINNNVTYIGNYFNDFTSNLTVDYINSIMDKIKFKNNIKKYKDKILNKLNNILLYFNN